MAAADRLVEPAAPAAPKWKTKLAHPAWALLVDVCPKCGFPEAEGGYCPECEWTLWKGRRPKGPTIS